MTIPKIIHQIWLQGWNSLPSKYEKNVTSILEHNKDWHHIRWDENSVLYALNQLGKQYVNKYNSYEHIHQRVDFARYAILYLYGGVSVDVDVLAYKNFKETPFIDKSTFIISYNSSNSFENYIKSGKSLVINNATILVNKRNRILKSLIDHVLTLSCDINESKYKCINETTGIKEFDSFLNNYKDQITVLDNVYLEPCQGSDRHCEINPKLTIIDHQHEGAWISPNILNIARLWYKIKAWKKEIAFFIIIGIVLIIIFANHD